MFTRAKVEIVRVLGKTREIYKLAEKDPDVEGLGFVKDYNDRILHLHGNCFYEGICKIPGIDLEKLIAETGRYIEKCKEAKPE